MLHSEVIREANSNYSDNSLIILLIIFQTKWQDNRMSTKQVTITVTQSIHQVDKNGKVKKSLTTYEVMKPVETLKQVATQNTWAQEEEAKEKWG